MEAGLGPLEMQVLGLLDEREGRSVRDVQAALSQDESSPAYTTVMTVLSRLHGKGLVRREKQGPRYLYRTAPKAPGFKGRLLRKVESSLFPNRLAPFAALLDQDLDREELEELKRLIDSKLKEQP